MSQPYLTDRDLSIITEALDLYESVLAGASSADKRAIEALGTHLSRYGDPGRTIPGVRGRIKSERIRRVETRVAKRAKAKS